MSKSIYRSLCVTAEIKEKTDCPVSTTGINPVQKPNDNIAANGPDYSSIIKQREQLTSGQAKLNCDKPSVNEKITISIYCIAIVSSL